MNFKNMKQILLFLSLVLFQTALSAQVKTAGVNYSVGAPAWTPSVNTGSELAIDTVSKRLYLWNRNTGAWDMQGRGVDQTSGSTPPAYTPNQTDSYLALNNANPPELYAWTGSAWAKVGGTVQTIDTFSVSGSIVSLSLSGDAQPAKTITLPASGITSLNSQTGATQAFATGTTGTDVGIVSSANTHTFNFPNASASARGLLTSADWSTFNGKVGGSGVSGQVGYFSGTSTLAGNADFTYNNTQKLILLTNSTYSSTDRGIRVQQSTGDGASALITFQKSRAGLVTSGTGLGTFDAQGFDGAAYQISSRISFSASGTPASGIIPGIITFSTANTSGVLTARSSINEAGLFSNFGNVHIGNGTNAARLHVQGAGSTSSTFTAQFHNSTGTNNALMVRDDGNVGVGTSAPSSSALLDVSSTAKGFLPPRMTATQASAIASPAEGLMVYVTNTNGTFTSKGWWGYNGAAWEKLNN